MSLFALPKGDSVSGLSEANDAPTSAKSKKRPGGGDSIVLILDQKVVVFTTKMILEGRLVTSSQAEVDMVTPLINTDLGDWVHVAQTIVFILLF